jgi:hypothetical protein
MYKFFNHSSMHTFSRISGYIFSITLILAVFAVPQAHAQAAFKDVPESHPFYQDIMLLKQLGVIGGYEDGTFKPDAPVNRAAALKIIFGLKNAELPETADAPFPDVNPAEWYAKYIAVAKKSGIVKGNPDGTFRPGDNVTKDAFISMLLKANGIDVTKHMEAKGIAKDVPDNAWSKPYLSYTKTLGITTADRNGNLNPGKQLTRGEVTAFMARLVRVLQGGDTQKNLNVAESKLIEAINLIRDKKINEAEVAVNEAVASAHAALQQKPDETVVQGAAKITEAFQKLIQAYRAGIGGDLAQAKALAGESKTIAATGASLFEGVKPIATQINAFADQIIQEVEAGGSADASAPTNTTDKEAARKAIQAKIDEINKQYTEAMATLNAQLDALK